MIRQVSLLLPILSAMVIAMSVASSIETSTPPLNHKEIIDVSSTALNMEPRSEVTELAGNLESSTVVSNVYPVYPEYRDKSGKTVQPSTKDSYLDALEYSHTRSKTRETGIPLQKPKPVKLIRRNYDGPVYRPTNEYGPPAKSRISYAPTPDSFLPTPSSSYSLPVQQAMNFADQNAYGTGMLGGQYGAPAASYGSPQVNYGPPQHYPPPQQQGWNGYALPEAPQLPQLPSLPSIDFSWPLAIKLNAFTIAKIILKLVIFKMIVKFIALICLLLFIPKLEIKTDKEMDDDDDESRRLGAPDSTLERLNILTAVVHDAIEKYQNTDDENHEADDCSNIVCRMRKFLISGESWNDYVNLFNVYAEEENPPDEADNRIDT